MPTHRTIRLLIALAGLALLLTGTAVPTQAQQQDTSSVLPDIAPREVEIRGQLEISLPSLERQPLVGFNPPPRIPEIPVDRSPWVGAYKQESADLPGSPLRTPEPPPALTGAGYPPARGLLAAWGGRYYSRGVRARVGGPIAEASFLHARIDYEGEDGHSPYDDRPDLQTPSDAFDGALGVQRQGNRWSVGVKGTGFYESYTLFAARPASGRPDLISEPVRKGGGGTGTIHVRTLAPGTFDLDASAWYGSARYQTRRYEDADRSGALLVRAQQHLGMESTLTYPMEIAPLWLEGRVQHVALGGDVDPGRGGSIAGGVTLRDDRRYRLRLGIRYLGAWSDASGLSSDLRRIDRVSPDVSLDVFPAQQIRLFARNAPHVPTPTLADAYALNPFLISQPQIRPSVEWLNAEGGVQVYAGPFQVVARGGYRDVRQFQYVEEATTRDSRDGYAEGLFLLRYADARILHAGADVSVVLPGTVHATLSGSYRKGTFHDLEGAIPYFADVVGEATLSYSFSQSRGLVQLTGRYERPRPRDRQETRTTGPYVDLDASLSYDVTEHIGLLVHLNTLSFGYHEYWTGYPRSPSIFGAGLRVRW